MFVFTVLWITVKRIFHNWRVVIGLFLGLVLAAGIISSIPIYSSGSLHRSFIEGWTERRTGRPPFALITVQSNERYRYDVMKTHIDGTRETLLSNIRRAVGYDPELTSEFVSLGSNSVLSSGDRNRSLTSPRGEIAALSNLTDVAEIIAGRWFEERDDGVFEVVVDELTYNQNELSLGQRLTYWYPNMSGIEGLEGTDEFVFVEVVVTGVFRAKPGTTMAEWIYPPPFFDRLFARSEDVLERLIGTHRLRPRTFDMLWVFDHRKLFVNQLPNVIARLEDAEERGAGASPPIRLWHHPLNYLRQFDEKRETVSLFLTTLSIPIVGMVLYYIALMAGVSVEHRKKEIAVLRSRGSGRSQILLSFLLEWVLLGAVAVAIGPYVGAFLARAMGSTTGFLEFVGRRGIPAAVDLRAYAHSALAASLAIVAGMIPVFGAVRYSVVTYTVARDRRPRVSGWHRFFIDIVILAVAAFGYSRMTWESSIVLVDEQLPADPLLFFVPVLFIIGGGLFVLRVYPLIMNVLRAITAKFPGVVWQMTFRRLSRNAGEYVPVMLLLIVTVSLGIYSAVTARTLRLNFEDTVRYTVGADVATTEDWHPPEASGAPASGTVPVTSEPPFYRREQIEGIESAARVLRGRVQLRPPEGYASGRTVAMMAIEPYEFSRTAWFRRDLATAHFYDYLSLLSRHPEGVILDTEQFRTGGYSLGDRITVVHNDQQIPAYVAGHVDFWPTLNPLSTPFAIMNLLHVQDYTALEPYGVWYRTNDSFVASDLVDALVGMGVYVTRLADTEAELVEQRREPYRMGFFGMLSMGFLAALVVSVLGFFIYTFFSIRSRLVQFGALRAMGFSSFQLIVVLAMELIATIGVSLGVGVGTGVIISRVFLPFIRERAAELISVPPFIIVARNADVYGILGVLGVLFFIALVALTAIIARLRLTRAIKLGEEV
ncbi:MAG: ABC transporter permease [Spirochaetaceae bacterium]|nr:MAG: ABC transporter permease [Spirochaetaceae bacterium]